MAVTNSKFLIKMEFLIVSSPFAKRRLLTRILDNMDDVKKVVIFVHKQSKADFLASFLSESGYPATSIHGGRFPWQREDAIRKFNSGEMKILVKTSVAAHGLDIASIQKIVSYDLPRGIDEFVRRIGQGVQSTNFFDPQIDYALAYDMVRILQQVGEVIPDCLSAYSLV